jgi:hypothetical protein
MQFLCSFCRQSVRFKSGGSAFVYSQILIHLEKCRSKPPRMTKARVVLIANDLTNEVVGW